ncbi:Nn.00g016000.m01.CDS01 [Neocucurbitaria sp. VM-36]
MPSSPKSAAANPNIIPDPTYSGSVIRKAFLAEAIANLFTIPLITNTRFTLSFLLNRPSDINPSSILFARFFGVLVGGLTTALLAGYPNTRSGVESRRSTYLLLGVGEALLVPILVLELLKDGGRDAAVSKKVALGGLGAIVPLLVWRSYVLFVNPDLLGQYREERKGDGSGRGNYGTIPSHEN